MTEAVESFFGWIKERHNIYLSRAAGSPPPWTSDPILSKYKFTNPFRENDRVTVWMRKHWTNQQDTRPFHQATPPHINPFCPIRKTHAIPERVPTGPGFASFAGFPVAKKQQKFHSKRFV